MSLLQTSVPKKYLRKQEKAQVKKDYKKYSENIHNGTNTELTEKVIDEMVCELNGLSEKEIGIVENS